MKRSIYVDCSFGISGDMFVSALVHALLPESLEIFREYSQKLQNAYGFKAEVVEASRYGIKGYQLKIEEPDMKFESLEDFKRALDSLEISEAVKRNSFEIIRLLAEAEARVHGADFHKIHFHELGLLDTLFDALLSAALVNELGIDAVFSSPVAVGSGTVSINHGIVSVPAPATIELLKGMPVCGANLEGEVSTPTGVAILKSLNAQFFLPDGFYVKSTGYGFGQRQFEHPNYLRIISGWVDESELEAVFEVSTNLDDATPQLLATAVSGLLERGALDAWIEPIVMKKGRPAHKLSVLCYEKDLESIMQFVFSETPAIGLRYHRVARRKLERWTEKVSTEFGTFSVKFVKAGKRIRASAEFEECVEASKRTGHPVDFIKRAVEERALSWIYKKNQGET